MTPREANLQIVSHYGGYLSTGFEDSFTLCPAQTQLFSKEDCSVSIKSSKGIGAV